MIKAVSFDWSGVISDDRPPVYYANMKVLEENAKETFDMKRWLELSKATAPDFFWSRGVEGTREFLEERYRHYLGEAKERGIVPIVYSDAEEVLVSLLGDNKHLSVVSSHPLNHLIQEIDDYGFDLIFNQVFGGQVGKVGGIREVLENLYCNPSELLYIGDTIFDIQAAKEVGVRSGGILTGYHSEEKLKAENPDYIFNNLTHLRSVILSE
ncbi:HAD family hydrolase [archaeon]|jgi:phosphoglycolate phosphatase|nr:HAD family hydrolase [archaeon]MBT5288070.1 HAD family hydrolase [archaeon]